MSVHKTIKMLGYDNSMGDYNWLYNAFIEDMGLKDKFEDWVLGKFFGELYERGYSDGLSRRPHNKRIKKKKAAFKAYHEGYLAGWRGE